jgi:hypothetical protein
MEKAGKTRAPWRSWTILALVLAALALAQACSDSGNRTSTPTKSTAVSLKVRKVAQVPPGCTGTLIIDGPNNFHLEANIPANGQVSVQVPIGVPLTFTVVLNCANGTFTGTTTLTAGPGNNEASVTVTATSAGVSCNPSTADPGENVTCVCNVSTPSPTATVTWQGATPTGPTTARFSRDNPGTFTVTCTVNNSVSASTNVTVVPVTVVPPVQNGTIQVTNTAVDCELQPQLCLQRRRILAQGPGAFFARVHKLPSGPTSALQEVHAGQTVQFQNLPPGDYDVEFFCSSESSEPQDTEQVTLPAGGTASASRNGFSLCD